MFVIGSFLVTFENFDSRLIEFKTLQRTIGKIGRKKFTSAFVAVGNGNGLVGKIKRTFLLVISFICHQVMAKL